VLFYAAKIAAAQISAPKLQLAAIIAAIRAEERSALTALKERRAPMTQARRQKRFAWHFAARAVSQKARVQGTARRPRRTHFRGRTHHPRR
jgi:hypothetical protein